MISQLLLQTNFLPQADAATTYITLGIIVGFILILVIGNIISNRKSTATGSGYISKSGSGRITTAKPVSYKGSKRKFRKIAKHIGVTSIQIKMLEDIAEKYRAGSPLVFLNSHNIFNITMKKAIQEYDSGAYSAEVKENYKMLLFNIKQKLDKSAVSDKKITSSRQLTTGKQITITTASGEKYSSHIITNLKDYICTTVPMRHDGTMLRLNKLEQVKVSIPEKGDRGYFYDSKILGYSKVKGTSCIMLQHSNNMQSSKQRNFPRKELGRSCYFYKINIATIMEGKTAVRKAVIDDQAKGRLGNVIEISAGGCSIKSPSYLNKGDLLRVDIDIERRKTVSVLGKIVNLRKSAPGTAIMHIQFTKMSKKNMNSINSYIYGIGEKTSILDY